jgi:hypothetical protein
MSGAATATLVLVGIDSWDAYPLVSPSELQLTRGNSLSRRRPVDPNRLKSGSSPEAERTSIAVAHGSLTGH